MSLSDELLESLCDESAVHIHSVSDSDAHFVIDPDTRQITSMSPTPNVLMQNDHRSEIYTFEIPRYVEGHDMLKCNRIRLHFINVGSGKQEYRDSAELSLRTNPADATTLISTWEIRRQAIQYAGKLCFLLQYLCVEDSAIVYEWHTDTYSDVEIRATFDNGEPATFEYSNILEDWYQKLFGAGDSVAADAIARIEAKTAEALASIPEDYATTANMAEEALRKKANAIIPEAEGEAILVGDSSDSALIGLRIFGKTTQAVNPTPAEPQALASLGAAGTVGVTVSGKNLVNIHRTDIGKISATVAVEGESITVATSPDDTFSRAVIPVTYPINTPLTISFDATILQGHSFMSPHAMPVYMRKGNVTSPHVNLEIATNKRSYTFTIPNGLPEAGYSLWLYIKTSADFVGKVEVKYENIQIEVGSVATEYEVYAEPQTLAASIPNGLPGIPVTTGGNYTDANGQQWVCDEVDFERGVFVQRVGRKTLNGVDVRPYYATHSNGQPYCAIYPGDNANSSPAMSSHYAFSPINWSDADNHLYGIGTAIILNDSRFTGVDNITGYWAVELPEVQYVLATPIETPLTDVELANFKMVCTYYHSTTVLNDIGAHMAIRYNADMKTYVDKSVKTSVTDVLEAIENGSY